MSRDQTAIATTIAELLPQLEPNAALDCQELVEALHDLLNRGGQEFCNEISIRSDRNKRRKARRRAEDGVDVREVARLYFMREVQNKRIRASKVDDLIRVTEILVAEASNTERTYLALADCAGPAQQDAHEGRQQRVFNFYRSKVDSTNEAESARRLSLLLVEREVRRLKRDAFHGTTDDGVQHRGAADAEQQFADLVGIDVTTVQKLRTAARSYAQVSTRDNGLGLLLMLGEQSRTMWERRLNQQDIACALEFCAEHVSAVGCKAAELQVVACKAVRRALHELCLDETELREQGDILAKHFRTSTQSGSARIDDTIVDDLALAAGQVDTRPVPSTALTLDKTPDLQVMHDQHDYRAAVADDPVQSHTAPNWDSVPFDVVANQMSWSGDFACWNEALNYNMVFV